jgi:hypothetical protein
VRHFCAIGPTPHGPYDRRVRAPVRPLRGTLPKGLESRFARFVWTDPRIVSDPDCTPERFRAAMAAFHVGKTIKITGVGRHGDADDLLVTHVSTSGRTVVDIGASDGSTSVELIAKLPDVGRFVIADLYFHLESYTWGGSTYYYGPDGDLILVAGRRTLAWPTLSRLLATWHRRGATRARAIGARTDVLLLNPQARRLLADDDRVEMAVHDVFTPWPDPKPDVIKVANVLRRLYFSDDEISAALDALLASLPRGGHLLVVDNPRIEGIRERAGLYRRDGDGFVAIARTESIPEIDDLVRAPRRRVPAVPA